MREGWKLALATAATFAALMLLWQGAIGFFALPEYVLPAPGRVGAALVQGWIGGTLWEHAWFTLRGALIGWAIGSLCGIAVGAIVAEVRVFSLAFYPLLIAFQSMPTVAIAPLLVVYLGVGLGSKIVTVALLCFFPVFVNTVAGFQATDSRLIDLYRAASATRFRMFLDIKLPSAVDHIMASLQIAAVLAFVGCVVSEFVASTAGLGYIIKAFANDLNVAVMFAAIASLGVIGATTAFLVSRLHQRLVFWRRR
ncbi:MAG: ABC transporter permease [Dongiaceae bacterium]